MANQWKNETQKVSTDNIFQIETQTNTIQDMFNNITARVSIGLDALKIDGNGVIGIKVSGIPTIKNAIDDYIDRINAQLDKVNTEVSAKTALVGQEMEDALTSYLSAIVDCCKKYITYLNLFKDLIDGVQKAYTDKQETMASTINTSMAEVNSRISAYDNSSK